MIENLPFSFSVWFLQLLGKLGENYPFCGSDSFWFDSCFRCGGLHRSLFGWSVAPVFTPARYKNIPHMQRTKTIPKGSSLIFWIFTFFHLWHHFGLKLTTWDIDVPENDLWELFFLFRILKNLFSVRGSMKCNCASEKPLFMLTNSICSRLAKLMTIYQK